MRLVSLQVTKKCFDKTINVAWVIIAFHSNYGSLCISASLFAVKSFGLAFLFCYLPLLPVVISSLDQFTRTCYVFQRGTSRYQETLSVIYFKSGIVTKFRCCFILKHKPSTEFGVHFSHKMKKCCTVNVQLLSVSIIFAMGIGSVCCFDIPTDFQEGYQQFPFSPFPFSDPVSNTDTVISQGNLSSIFEIQQ